MTVVWTLQALDRLAEIEAFIAEDDPIAAEQHTERLIARAEILEKHPRIGRVVPEAPGGELRELLEGHYRIVYRLRGERVEILTVFEGHRLMPEEDLPSQPDSTS